MIRKHATFLALIIAVSWAAPAWAQDVPPAGETGDETAAADTTAETGDEGKDDTAVTAVPKPPTNLRLRALEQKVQALKEQAWRIKARVGMLKEAVLGGGIGARASITHKNKMGGSFHLIRLVYALDGTQIFARADDGGGKLNELKSFDILSGPIAPGNHTLSVLMLYRGHGYGVFAYLKDYKFTVRSSHTFTATEGRSTQITVVGYEKGGLTTPLEKRPAVDFRVNVIAERQKGK